MATCLECGKPFQAIRSSKKYCSAACKQTSYLKRLAVKHGDDNSSFYGKPYPVSDGNDAKQATVSDDSKRFYGKHLTVAEDTDDKELISGDDNPSFYDTLCKVFTVSDDKQAVNANSKEYKAKESVTVNADNYQWIVPQWFVTLEEQIEKSRNRLFFQRNGHDYFIKKVNTQFKSILHQMLRMSYRDGIGADDLTLLYNATIELEESSAFRCADNHPYTNRIKQLTAKWSVFLDDATEDTLFSMSDTLKQEVFRMLCEIGDTVKHIPFDTLFKHLYEEEE